MKKTPPPTPPFLEDIMTDGPQPPKRGNSSHMIGPFSDLPTLLSQVKGQRVEMWRETGGRRQPMPGPYEGVWPVEMLRDGSVKVPPNAVFKDPSTGLSFRLDMSMEMSSGQPNGFGQQVAQSQGDISGVVRDFAGLVIQENRELRAENRSLLDRLDAANRRVAELELEVEKASSQPDGVVETLLNNFSKTDHGQVVLAGFAEEALGRFAGKPKSPA